MTMKTSIQFSKKCLAPGLVAALALWGSWNVQAAAESNGQLDRRDASFVRQAIEDNLGEIQLGKLAMQQGQNQQIKELGEHLQKDHMQANQELTQIAQKDGMTVPAELNRKETREADKLQGKTGAEFDKDFAAMVLKDHEKDIDKFQKALQNAQDPALKAWIAQTIPALRHHLQMARDAGSAVGVSQRELSSADRYLTESNATGAAPGAETGTGLNRNQTTIPGQPK